VSDQAQGLQGLAETGNLEVACYPNPVSSQSAISFDLKEPSHVLLEIFDNLGQKVSVLADENVSAGTQHITWNAEGKPPGTYYYRLEADGQKSSGTMIVKN
jgi:serine protease AprX